MLQRFQLPDWDEFIPAIALPKSHAERDIMGKNSSVMI